MSAIEWCHHHINVVVVCAFCTTCGASDAILMVMCDAMCETTATDNTLQGYIFTMCSIKVIYLPCVVSRLYIYHV